MSGPQAFPWLAGVAPYEGGESKVPGVDKVIKLASNEGALGPSPMAMEALTRNVGQVFRYPDGNAVDLREAIAAFNGLDAARIVAGAGSDDLIHLLCRGYAGPGDEILLSAHGFAMYPIYARVVGATLVMTPETNITVDVDAMLERVTDKTKLVFIANPNNPTGTYLPDSEVRRLHAGLPENVLMVLDSAYAEYVVRNDYSTGVELATESDNVVMLRTFSKMYGLGGLRLGWAYCPPSVADILNRIRNPFNVSVAAQIAGPAALQDQEFVARSLAHNNEWRAWTVQALRDIGLAVPEGVANFVLVRFADEPGRTAEDADKFLKSRGVIARRMGGYGLPDSLRVSIGREDEMRFVVETLGAFLNET